MDESLKGGSMKKKKVCKHKWAVAGLTPWQHPVTGELGVMFICLKCLEKKCV